VLAAILGSTKRQFVNAERTTPELAPRRRHSCTITSRKSTGSASGPGPEDQRRRHARTPRLRVDRRAIHGATSGETHDLRPRLRAGAAVTAGVPAVVRLTDQCAGRLQKTLVGARDDRGQGPLFIGETAADSRQGAARPRGYEG